MEGAHGLLINLGHGVLGCGPEGYRDENRRWNREARKEDWLGDD